MSLLLQLRSKWIDHFKKRELVEIGIPGADSPDPMLAHENGRVRVVEQIASEVWQLQDDVFGDVGVSLRRNENGKARRGKQRGNEFPGRGRAPRPSHHPRG